MSGFPQANGSAPPGGQRDSHGSPSRSLVWWAVLGVACCGVVATAHGLYEVAQASGAPWFIAVLYPVIADGLALAAYASTKRLASAKYPWLVVIVAASLSGTAQGWFLASLSDRTGTTWWLRFGIGAGVAVAVLAAAHLLWLVGRPNERPTAPGFTSAASNARPVEHPVSAEFGRPSNRRPTGVQPPSNGSAKTAAGRAHAAALTLREPDGQWPTVEALAAAAKVSRGTAGTALKGLRR